MIAFSVMGICISYQALLQSVGRRLLPIDQYTIGDPYTEFQYYLDEIHNLDRNLAVLILSTWNYMVPIAIDQGMLVGPSLL